MIIIVCIDEKKGMLFNRRRQSQDRILREDLLQHCRKSTLYMNDYSHKLFAKMAAESPVEGLNIQVSEDFMELAGPGDYCFVENVDITPWLSQVEAVIAYQWNRHYPVDVYFPLDLDEDSWELAEEHEFAGSSHEKITKRVFWRRKNSL